MVNKAVLYLFFFVLRDLYFYTRVSIQSVSLESFAAAQSTVKANVPALTVNAADAGSIGNDSFHSRYSMSVLRIELSLRSVIQSDHLFLAMHLFKGNVSAFAEITLKMNAEVGSEMNTSSAVLD